MLKQLHIALKSSRKAHNHPSSPWLMLLLFVCLFLSVRSMHWIECDVKFKLNEAKTTIYLLNILTKLKDTHDNGTMKRRTKASIFLSYSNDDAAATNERFDKNKHLWELLSSAQVHFARNNKEKWELKKWVIEEWKMPFVRRKRCR